MTTLSPAETSYIITGLSAAQPTRSDGRGLLNTRPISISYGDAPQASGSSRVKLAGGTEVIAGIRLEVGDVDPHEKSKAWRTRVEVDVTPQAYPHLSQQGLSSLSARYTTLLNDHFVPSIPPLPILPPTKYFIPSLQLTLISASSGSVPSTLVLAARAAFQDLKVPRTKSIALQPPADLLHSDDQTEADGETDMSGIKAAIRSKGRGKGKAVMRGGDDWDLDPTAGGLEQLEGREELPVMVTLNLVPGSDNFFLDATPQEEIACPDKLHLFFRPSGKICGVRLEGDQGLPIDRIKPLLMEGQKVAVELAKSLNQS